ncbi:MAG: GDSL-type esterase/lipase family protein, partial [Chitinophagaceae bacterium]
MKITKFFLCAVLFSGIMANNSFAQITEPPFWNEIQHFWHEDSLQPPPQHAILFIGSSSFRKWTDVQDYFPGYKIINRGFGGSTLPDIIRYANEIIFPYHPKQIVIYCGDNDAASSNDITADSILNRFKTLYFLIRKHLPKTEVTYVSIKPSPSREQFFPVMQFANWEIQQFLKREPHATFVDVWHLMLDDHGQPVKSLFGPDMLHMNKTGYDIWAKAI